MVSRWIVDPVEQEAVIQSEVHGHFAEHLGRCIYDGLFVGRQSSIPNIHGIRLDVLEALRAVGVPVLRWPGGCFAEYYHWRDGVGTARRSVVNAHWGGQTEDNSFGTHEFMELCELLGSKPYICGNVSSGTPQEMAEWVEYLTSDNDTPMTRLRRENGRDRAWDVPYWGVGNENWGAGGLMRPQYYADLYRQYTMNLNDPAPERRLCKIACGANAADFDWTETVMKAVAPYLPMTRLNVIGGLSLHYYAKRGNSWDGLGAATGFTREEYYGTLQAACRMDELLTRHGQIMDRYDPEKRVGLMVDEWGTWFDAEQGTHPRFLYQQNTMRDALVAAITLNLFHKHASRVRMANIAQLVNVLQALILTDGDRMITTPTYHVFRLFAPHRGARLVHSYVQRQNVGEGAFSAPDLSESASMDESGALTLTIANCGDLAGRTVRCTVVDHRPCEISAQLLCGRPDAHNEFDRPDAVAPMPCETIRQTEDGFMLELPPCAVASIRLKPVKN